MNRVRIAVAGAGLIGQRHIEEIGKSRGSALSSIVDVSAKAADTAKRLGVPLYDSLAAPCSTSQTTISMKRHGGGSPVADRS